MPEMYENPSEILVVLLQPMIKSFYLRFEQESQDTFFQLSRPFTGNNLYQSNLLFYGFYDNPV